MTMKNSQGLSRRGFLHGMSLSATALIAAGYPRQEAAAASLRSAPQDALPAYTGPQVNPYWNAVGPYVTYPQKLPLIQLTDRPVQLETPRAYFTQVYTPNEAMFVRYHLAGVPNRVDLAKWHLTVEGRVEQSLTLSFADLLRRFEPVEVAAVMQCSGNSRSYFQPRVAGGQWGNGAMANALWKGVRLRDVIQLAGLERGAVQIQFQGLDFGPGPNGYGSHAFLKSWDIDDPALDQAVLAYSMNGQPLPMLNGFPLRMIFPGKFATYWVKHLSWIRVLDHKDRNFWMARAYKIPATPNGATTPQAIAAGGVDMVPIGAVNMPVRSFITAPDGSSKVPAGMPVTVRGVAFSGTGPVLKVEYSADDGKTWAPAQLGKDHGPYSFRSWRAEWKPRKPGKVTLAVRATDSRGNFQSDSDLWNPGGYLRNSIERQPVMVGRGR